MATPEHPGEEQKSGGPPGVLAWLALLALLAGIALVLYRIYPSETPLKENAGWLDTIFASNLVVFAGRLVLLSAGIVLAFFAAHMVWSVVRWFQSGQLLSKLGPIHVSERAVETLEAELAYWRAQAAGLAEQVEVLSERLRESDEVLASLLEEEPGGEPEFDDETELGEDANSK
jgi:Na+/phosphate symporter